MRLFRKIGIFSQRALSTLRSSFGVEWSPSPTVTTLEGRLSRRLLVVGVEPDPPPIATKRTLTHYIF